MSLRLDGPMEKVGKVILDIDLPFEDYEMALACHPRVNEFRRKMKRNDSSLRNDSASTWELEVGLSGFSRPFTTGMGMPSYGHLPGKPGVYVYHNMLPDIKGYYETARKVMNDAIRDAVQYFSKEQGVVERTCHTCRHPPYGGIGANASGLQPAFGGMFHLPPAERQQMETQPALPPQPAGIHMFLNQGQPCIHGPRALRPIPQ